MNGGAQNPLEKTRHSKKPQDWENAHQKMKRIFTLILLIVLCSAGFAQNNLQDVVYLKNGSVIRGLIVEQVPNESIKIETADRSVFFFKIDEIAKIAKEDRKPQRNNVSLKEGYQTLVELGYGFKSGDYGLNVLKLNLIEQYRINNNFSVGLGTGARHYAEDGESATLIPVFADLRANIVQGNIAPYLALGIGYAFNATYSFSGVGMLINPTAGVAFPVNKKSMLNVGLGYEMQRSKVTYYGDTQFSNPAYQTFLPTSITSGAISLNVGISF
jgi:hypothetical protein